MNRNILRKIPAILIMLGITVLSALPSNDPFLNTFQFNDKIKHFIAYFVLGLAFCIWISGKNWLVKPFFWGIIVVVLGTLFGIADEFHQSFVPGRSGNNLGDITADFIGVLFSPFLYFRIIKVACR